LAKVTFYAAGRLTWADHSGVRPHRNPSPLHSSTTSVDLLDEHSDACEHLATPITHLDLASISREGESLPLLASGALPFTILIIVVVAFFMVVTCRAPPGGIREDEHVDR
jgi:hypothetical protein